jgi:hypothetical protein
VGATARGRGGEGRLIGTLFAYPADAPPRLRAHAPPFMKIHVPEVIEPDEKLPADLVALRRFATLMDEAVAVPGTRRRVGLDAAVGLIPGVGDLIGGLMSAVIVAAAIRHRVPIRKISRMIVNILIDVCLGEIPVVGDIFDFLFEENMMNMRILMTYRDRRRPPRTTREIALAVTLIGAFIVLLSVISGLAGIAAILWLAGKRNVF